jgi:hypothetical protein
VVIYILSGRVAFFNNKYMTILFANHLLRALRTRSLYPVILLFFYIYYKDNIHHAITRHFRVVSNKNQKIREFPNQMHRKLIRLFNNNYITPAQQALLITTHSSYKTNLLQNNVKTSRINFQ